MTVQYNNARSDLFMQTVMMSIVVDSDCVFLRTVSRNYRSPQRFVVLKKELSDLENNGQIIVRDICSFAVLKLYKALGDAEVLQIEFFWLNKDYSDSLSGGRQLLEFSYSKFLHCIKDGKGNLLFKPKYKKPKIEFQSKENLRNVIAIPTLRKKLGKFLVNNFNWYYSQSIVIVDDFEPYNFFFTEKRRGSDGICGGIILHKQEDLAKAYYAIHT